MTVEQIYVSWVSNMSRFTQSVEEGLVLREAVPAVVVQPTQTPAKEHMDAEPAEGECEQKQDTSKIRRIMYTYEQAHRKRLLDLVEQPGLPELEKNLLYEFLANHHHLFSLEDKEYRKTAQLRNVDQLHVRPKEFIKR